MIVHSAAKSGSIPAPDMSALIARLEAAEAGGRELDAAVWAASNGYEIVRFDGAGWLYNGHVDGGQRHERLSHIPAFSQSLDAALALAERVITAARLLDIEGSWEPHDKGVWPAWSVRWYPDGTLRDGKSWHARIGSGRTPALALCIAILKAKTQGEGG